MLQEKVKFASLYFFLYRILYRKEEFIELYMHSNIGLVQVDRLRPVHDVCCVNLTYRNLENAFLLLNEVTADTAAVLRINKNLRETAVRVRVGLGLGLGLELGLGLGLGSATAAVHKLHKYCINCIKRPPCP